jgi:hypothetical protein
MMSCGAGALAREKSAAKQTDVGTAALARQRSEAPQQNEKPRRKAEAANLFPFTGRESQGLTLQKLTDVTSAI